MGFINVMFLARFLIFSSLLGSELSAASGYELWAETMAPGQSMQDDQDEDGVPNGIEYFFGVRPGDPRMTVSPGIVDGRIRWPFAGVPDLTYQVQTSTTLAADDWRVVDPALLVLSEPGFISYQLPPATSESKIFVRLMVESLFSRVVPGNSATEWRPLLEDPPTVTFDSSSGIASGTTYQTFLNGVKQPDYDLFDLRGGVFAPASPSGSLNSYASPAKITGLYLTLNGAIEFITDSDSVGIGLYPGTSTASSVALWVDGKLVRETPFFTTVVGGIPQVMKLTFAVAQTRRIRMEFSGMNGFSWIRVPTPYQISKPTNPPVRCILIGDSFTEPTGTLSGRKWDGLGGRLAQKTGWDVWQSGAGGTGYVNPGPGGRFKFRDRLQTDVIDFSPRLVIWAGGINDSSPFFYSADNVYSEALACYTAVKNALPGCRQVAFGPWWPRGNPNADILAVEDQIRRAAEAAGIFFIPTVSSGSRWITANNSESYHPRVAASGVVTRVGETVSSVAVTGGGNGYPSSPAVSFSGGGGSGAAGTAVIDGRIQSVTLLNGGAGYVNPVISFTGDGSGASAVATVVDGAITEITMLDQGSGYSRQPVVSISDSSGSGAVAVAAHTYRVVGVNITDGGQGYTSTPAVTFGAPSDGTHPRTAGHAYYAERMFYEIHKLFR